jgi:hypothetical protein
MKSFQPLIGLLLVIATSAAAGHALSGRSEQAATTAGGTSPQASGGTFPKDVYADTGNRLPAIKREAMDDAGKKLFDTRGPADAFGPGGIRLYSPPMAEQMTTFGTNPVLTHASWS